MNLAIHLSLNDIVPYLRTGGGVLTDELRALVERRLAEAPVDPRGLWKTEGDVIYLCGTIGVRFDQWQRRLSVLGAADALIAQAIGAAAVEAVMDELEAEAKAATPGAWGPRRSPGYGAIPLAESLTILAKLDATKQIGVACTNDFLLAPAKSVTAICRREGETF